MTEARNEVAAVTAPGGALATVPEISFNLPALTNKEEALEVMADNLAELGGTLPLDRVKIPSGGGLSFEVIDDSGQSQAVTELTGVVLDHYPINAWWAKKFEGGNNPPECSSLDGRTGSGNPEHGIPAHQDCAKCPKNAWGSDPDGGKGKWCKNMFRVYLVQEGSVFPVLVTLPPTSMGNWRDYMKRLANKMRSIHGVVTVIKLEKDKNANGIQFSKATFAKAHELTAAERVAIKEYAKQLSSAMRQVAVDGVEYNTEPDQYDGGGNYAAGAEENPY